MKRLPFALSAAAWFLAAADAASTGAGEPAAHAPGYADKTLWPAGEAPAYTRQDWPAARLLVWARPGRDGKWTEARNWVDASKNRPAGRAPDRETDVVLPASNQPYTVSTSSRCHCRHITVEAGALAVGYHNGYNNLNIWGNAWIKKGGRIHFIDIVGPFDTFLRVDNPLPRPGDKGMYHFTPKGYRNDPRYHPSHIHHKMSVCKYEDASVELVGTMGVGDEFYLSKGTVVLGPDSEFRYRGSRSKGTFEIFDGGTLQVQSGATLAPFDNKPTAALNLSVYRGGVLRAGSPKRPISRDAHVLLSMGPGEKVGLYAAEGSTVRVHSADPTEARLVFAGINAREDFTTGRAKRLPEAGRKAESDSYGIVLRFAGRADLDGVVFDYVRAGGIRLADPDLARTWRHVSYGRGNAAAEGALYGRLKMDPDIYYHKRRYMRYRHRVGKDLSEMRRFQPEDEDGARDD